ncbi:MAG: hypothetical protein R3Y49_03945 [Rikenellaceae bacterium]
MKKTRIYSREEKLRLLSEYSDSGLTATKFQQIRGMGHCTLSNWFATFAREDDKQKEDPIMSIKNKPVCIKSLREIELEQENKLLQEKLAYEKLRAQAYDTMIDIAERELNIEIRKKSGAKQ